MSFIFYPVNKCTVFVSCTTGLGDLMFETFSAVSIVLLSGCEHANVITSYTREHGYYNLSRIQSPYFTYYPAEKYNWVKKPQYTLPWSSKVFNPECGIKDYKWVSSMYMHTEEKTIHTMKQVSSSIYLDKCNDRTVDISVHSRRGDKIKTKWSSVTSLRYNYDKFTLWLINNKIQHISLASDDHKWAVRYIKELKLHSIQVTYKKNSAIEDLCMLHKSRMVVRLGTASTFSAISAILGHVNLSVIGPNVSDHVSIREYNRAHDMDMHWIHSGILNITVL